MNLFEMQKQTPRRLNQNAEAFESKRRGVLKKRRDTLYFMQPFESPKSRTEQQARKAEY